MISASLLFSSPIRSCILVSEEIVSSSLACSCLLVIDGLIAELRVSVLQSLSVASPPFASFGIIGTHENHNKVSKTRALITEAISTMDSLVVYAVGSEYDRGLLDEPENSYRHLKKSLL